MNYLTCQCVLYGGLSLVYMNTFNMNTLVISSHSLSTYETFCYNETPVNMRDMYETSVTMKLLLI